MNMILINNNWEEIYDLQDVSRIIREHYNSELADELDKLIDNVTQLEDDYDDLKNQLDDAEYEIDSLESDIWDKEEEIRDLENEIEDLKEEISKLENFHYLNKELNYEYIRNRKCNRTTCRKL